LKTENPHQLFEAPASTRVTQGNIFVMSPHPDGQRFLVNMLIETGEFTINVVTNISKLIADRRTDASDR